MRSISDIIRHKPQSATRNESPIEVMLFDAFMRRNDIVLMRSKKDKPYGAGLFLYPQFQLGNFRADFILHCRGWNGIEPRVWPPKRKKTLCIECDGKEFHQDKQKDYHRDLYFKKRGIQTLRFTGSDIYLSADDCVRIAIQNITDDMDKV